MAHTFTATASCHPKSREDALMLDLGPVAIALCGRHMETHNFPLAVVDAALNRYLSQPASPSDSDQPSSV